MAAVGEPSILLRSIFVGTVAVNVILLGYAVRDYSSGSGSGRTLLLPIGGLALGTAMLIGQRRPRLSWALLAVTLVVNAAWFMRSAT